MTLFYDKDGNGYIAQMNLTRTIDVSGNISISGTIFNGNDVLQNIGYGWSFKFQDEKYIISYTKLNDEDNIVEFDAVHKFLWDFSKSVFYESWTGSHTFEAYLDALFNDSGYTYDLQTTVAAFEKDNWGMKNKADLLSDIISDAGVELEIRNLKVTIKAQIGSDLTSIARYGINLSDLIEENNISKFATHGRGFGAYNDKNDTSKGRLEVEYTSDLAKTYGILDLDPIVDERYTIADNLLSAVKAKVDATFAVSVSLNMHDLENAGYPNYDSPQVGDWILAIDEKLNFKRKVRIIKLEEEFDANEKRIGYTVTAGDLSQAEQLQSAQVSATNAIQQLQQDVITVYYAANGKNRTFTGTDDPNTLGLTNLISGDVYWRTNGDKKELWIYDGTRWNQEVTDATGVEITAKVDTAMADVDTAKKNASTAVETANTAINNASVATNTAQNAADTATAVQQQVITLKGGSTLTIAELESGLSTKVSSDDFNSYRTQTDNALVDKVSSSDFTSYRTQTDSAIQDRITTTDAQALVTTTANTWQTNLSALQTQVNNSAVGTNLIVASSVINAMSMDDNGANTGYPTTFITDYIEVVAGENYTISTTLSSSTSRIAFYDSSKTFMSRLADQGISNTVPQTIMIPTGVSFIRFSPNEDNGKYENNFKLEKGSHATDYSANPSDNATTVALTAVNTSLTSAINLRVQKNDVINQINVSSEGILIDGAKVHITGTTTIDNAVIKSAMIDSLSASKLTAGTIDASVISVINLNANNISSGTITGVTFHQTSSGHDTIIDGNGINDYDSSGNHAVISKGNLQVYDYNNHGFFMSGGALQLTSASAWGTSENPMFGTIKRDSNIFSTSGNGMVVQGTDGLSLRSNSFSSSYTLTERTSQYSGSGINIADSTMLLASNGRTVITGGTPYNEYLDKLPKIEIGSNAWYPSGSGGSAGATIFMQADGLSADIRGEVYFNSYSGAAFTLNNMSLQVPKGTSSFGDGLVVKNLSVTNWLGVSGSKNSMVRTSAGVRAVNAYEVAEYYFGDLAKVNTGSGSKVKIMMDSLFLETVNTKIDYHVFVSSYGNGYAWVSEQAETYFIIESSVPNIVVSYEIKAKRLGYENNRLELEENLKSAS